MSGENNTLDENTSVSSSITTAKSGNKVNFIEKNKKTAGASAKTSAKFVSQSATAKPSNTEIVIKCLNEVKPKDGQIRPKTKTEARLKEKKENDAEKDDEKEEDIGNDDDEIALVTLVDEEADEEAEKHQQETVAQVELDISIISNRSSIVTATTKPQKDQSEEEEEENVDSRLKVSVNLVQGRNMSAIEIGDRQGDEVDDEVNISKSDCQEKSKIRSQFMQRWVFDDFLLLLFWLEKSRFLNRGGSNEVLANAFKIGVFSSFLDIRGDPFALKLKI